ncbi:MAG: PAS domain S-box protein [Caldilineaceae bacterium]
MIGIEETTLQLLLEHTPAAVAIFDSNMRYLAASRRYTADYHLAGDSLAGRSHYEVFPEIGERWKEIHRRCLNGAVERGKDELFLREDGTQDWVSWEIHPWREATGAIGGIMLFSEVISAQKRLEQELAAQERDLEAVINNTDGSIWAVDAQYRLIAGNARYHGDVRAVAGRTLEKGESVLLPAFSAAALAEWQSYYDRALQGEQFSVEVGTRFAQPQRLVEYRVSPIRAGDGTITGVTVFGRDVTEQRQLYAVARERKEKLDKLLDLLPVGVSVLDGERNIVFSNRALGEIVDLAGDELAEKAYRARRYVKSDGTPLTRAGFASEQAMTSRLPVHAVETGIVKKDGEVIWTSVSALPVDFPDWRVIVTTVDITELKRMQQELIDLNRTLEARVAERTAEVQDLYDRAPAGYHSLDPQGRIIRINQTELDWLGYTREEVIGRPITDFFTPANRAAFPADYAAFQQLDWLRDQERDLVRKDGSIIPVVVNATAIRDEAGRYVMSRSTVSDNTRRKQAEETLRFANHELERAMRLKDEFLANMSHELRTPLNAILTLTEVMLDGVYGDLPPRQERAMRHVDASGRHLLELINDLLDLSKVEAGKLTLEIEATAPDGVCQDSMLFVKDLADKKDILLSYNNDDPAARVLADPRRLKQMLVNLLSNAVKFTPDGGRVHLHVLALDSTPAVEFAVQDTGPGIAAEDQPRLFQPFMQLDASLAREHDGTGLGLALVKRLAEQHGGTVRVESRGIPGHGSRFIISLPRVAANGDE